MSHTSVMVALTALFVTALVVASSAFTEFPEFRELDQAAVFFGFVVFAGLGLPLAFMKNTACWGDVALA